MFMCRWKEWNTFGFLVEKFGLCGFTLANLFTTYSALEFESRGRCLSRLMAEDGHVDRLVSGHWPIERAQRLSHEVLAVLQRTLSLGVSKIGWIEENKGPLGLCLRTRWDQIFVQVGGVPHPYLIVLTVLHEVGHQLVYRCGHQEECDPHCAFFERCNRFVMATFVVSWNVICILH